MKNHDLDWVTRSACDDPQVYFPDSNKKPAPEAIDVCINSCPVRKECLRWGYAAFPESAGYFGGLGRGDRKRFTLEEALAAL